MHTLQLAATSSTSSIQWPSKGLTHVQLGRGFIQLALQFCCMALIMRQMLLSGLERPFKLSISGHGCITLCLLLLLCEGQLLLQLLQNATMIRHLQLQSNVHAHPAAPLLFSLHNNMADNLDKMPFISFLGMTPAGFAAGLIWSELPWMGGWMPDHGKTKVAHMILSGIGQNGNRLLCKPDSNPACCPPTRLAPRTDAD